MNSDEINQYPNMPDIERPPRKAKDLYSGMPFRRKGSNILYAVDGINTSRNILRVIAYVNTRLHRYEAWKLSDTLAEFRRGVLFFAMDLEVSKAPALHWKPKFRLMPDYLTTGLKFRHHVWHLVTKNQAFPTCDRCFHVARGVLLAGPFRIPLCRAHFLALYPEAKIWPEIRYLSDFRPTEAPPTYGFI